MKSTLATSILIIGHLLATSGGTMASAIAYDSAGDSAYNSSENGVQPALNGGYGWGGGWEGYGLYYGIEAVSPGAAFNETGLVGSGIINSPRTAAGRTWLMQPRQNAPGFNGYMRPLSGSLAMGQTFSVDFAESYTSLPGGYDANVGLYDYDIPAGVTFSSKPGIGVGATTRDGTDFVILDRLPDYLSPIHTGIPLTDEAVHMDLTLLSASEAQITVTSLAPDHLSATAIVPVAGPLGAFGAYARISAGSVYFNNTVVTPEPIAPALLLFCAIWLALGRARFRARSANSAL